jgi:hypothetical protein
VSAIVLSGVIGIGLLFYLKRCKSAP